MGFALDVEEVTELQGSLALDPRQGRPKLAALSVERDNPIAPAQTRNTRVA